MKERLRTIFSLLPGEGRGVIDVGTDHGYIPIALAQSGYKGRIFASDLREGPLEVARRHAEETGFADRICFLLCSGLRLCEPGSVDTVVIAGMGGDTICAILDEAEWLQSSDCALFLQPMTHAELVRYWLCHNGFSIPEERIAAEEGRLYQIIHAVPGLSPSLRDFEYLIGERALSQDRELRRRLAERELERAERRLSGLAAAGEKSPFYEALRDELINELLP